MFIRAPYLVSHHPSLLPTVASPGSKSLQVDYTSTFRTVMGIPTEPKSLRGINVKRLLLSPYGLLNAHCSAGTVGSVSMPIPVRKVSDAVFKSFKFENLYTRSFTTMSRSESLAPYQRLCTEYYDLDKPIAPSDSLALYTQYASESKGPILEPMCGTGCYLIPLLKQGYHVTGFDLSPHMLDVCQRKLHQENLPPNTTLASFETFAFQGPYGLIMIPTSSFCLLTSREAASTALKCVVKHLAAGGKFVFEVDTLKSVTLPQGTWKGRWLHKPDGSKLVLSTFSRFNVESRIDEMLCRYELWQDNAIAKTEVEDLHVRLYEMREIETLLEEHHLTVVNKWLPHAKIPPDDQSQTVLYECIKL